MNLQLNRTAMHTVKVKIGHIGYSIYLRWSSTMDMAIVIVTNVGSESFSSVISCVQAPKGKITHVFLSR